LKKILLGFVLVLVLLVGGVSLYVNEVVGTAIEKSGTYALGVDTTVGFVRLRLVRTDFRVNRLRIANPPGFGEPQFLRMEDATISVDRGTLMEPVVRIPELRLERIVVALEKEGSGTNYGVILDNVQRFEKESASEGADPPDDPEAGKRFIVNRLLITDVEAYVEWNELAADATGLRITIPQIELKDIGAESAKGVAMSELTNIVLKAVLGSIQRYGGDLPGAMMSALQGGLGGVARVPGVVVSGVGGSLVEQAGAAVGGEVGDAIRGVGGSAVEGVSEAAGKEASRALGGLFGGGDEKE
jgi:hypothetical protein